MRPIIRRLVPFIVAFTIFTPNGRSSTRGFGSQQLFPSEPSKARETWADIRKRYGLPDKPAEVTDAPTTPILVQALGDAEAVEAKKEREEDGVTEDTVSGSKKPKDPGKPSFVSLIHIQLQ